MFKLLILDVDGVLTTGLKTYDINGSVISKTFGDRDFTAIKQFICAGIETIFLSGDQQVNSAVANNRGIPFFYSRRDSGQLSKSDCAKEILEIYKVKIDNIIFVGDDLFDVEMRSFCKFMACPSNSHYLMKENADLILNTASGHGCVQELFEYMVSKLMIKEPSNESVIKRDSSESVKY